MRCCLSLLFNNFSAIYFAPVVVYVYFHLSFFFFEFDFIVSSYSYWTCQEYIRAQWVHNHRRGIGVIEEKEYGVLKSSDGAVDISQHKDGAKKNNRNRGITKRSASNLPTKEGLVAGVEDGGGHVHLFVGRPPLGYAVEDHVPSHALLLVLMSSSDGRVIPGTDGTFLLLFACGVPLNCGKQVKAYRIVWSTVFPMNCSWKYLIGVDWNH